MGLTETSLKKKMLKLGLGIRSKYCTINDTLLRGMVQDIVNENNELGKPLLM